MLIIQHRIQLPSLDFEVQNEEEKITQCRNGSKIRIEKYYRKGKLDTLLHKHMTTQYQNTIPLRLKQFSSSMVLYGNHLSESIVNKPLSFLSHFFFFGQVRTIHVILIQEKEKRISLLCP